MAVGCEKQCDSCQKKISSPEATHVQRTDLIEEGKTPRLKLEVGRWSGLKYSTIIHADYSVGASGVPPVQAPTTITKIRFRVTRGTADPVYRTRGDSEIALVEEEAVIDSMEVASKTHPPELMQLMNSQLAAFAGSTMKQLVAEDAEVVDMTAEKLGGVDTPAELKQILDGAWDSQLRFPFRLPKTAVGQGAQWRFTEKLRTHNLNLVQVADMTLVGMDQTQAQISIRARQEAPAQDFPDPQVPGAVAHLNKYRGDGHGSVIIDRVTAVPMQAKYRNTAQLTATTDRPGEGKRRVTLTVVTTVTLETVLQGDGGTELLEDEAVTIGEDAAVDASADATDATDAGQ